MRFYFHTANGQRSIDRIGIVFDSDDEAKVFAIRKACEWVGNDPELLIVDKDCRVEVTDERHKVLFSIIMFAVDNKAWTG